MNNRFRSAKSSFVVLLIVFPASVVLAQQPDTAPPEQPAPQVPQRVDVAPIAQDSDIANRLTRILEATEWFEQPEVRVEEGVVFLNGQAEIEQHKEWAGRLAGNTQDVVAVVNRIQVAQRSMWDLSPAWNQLRELARDTVRQSPMIVLGLLLLFATWVATGWSRRGASSFLRARLKGQLLRDVVSRAIAIPVFLLGLYLVLRISGLAGLALTVLGGTGLLGLIIGFAFRDIAENFLASVLISMQHPFARGDLIEVAGFRGYVQSVNTRSTLLMTLEGNHVQIPNATIYKGTIINFTANPKTRFDFTVGIGYDDSIAEAQAVALSVLHNHTAVVDDPEPLVLVETLGPATVILRVYFWVDIATYSHLKVRSAVIRLVKRAFDEAGISMPDEAREVVFPGGVPVRILSEGQEEARIAQRDRPRDRDADKQTVDKAEGDLMSEAAEIQAQAKQARSPEGATNLLEDE